jgi:uncharacterized protein YaiI (UPF0178 family)
MTPLEIAVNALIDEGQSYQDVQNEFNCILTRRAWTDKKRENIAQREYEAALSADEDRVAAEKSAHLDRLRGQLRDGGSHAL